MEATKQTGIVEPPGPIQMNFATGSMGSDSRIQRSSKTAGEMKGVFLDEAARQRIDSNHVIYAVEYWKPVQDGTEGGLYWGNSTIFPGVVGLEYFMTRGHFHKQRNRAEYYATISGSGMLVLMDEQRHASVQKMSPGTAHYIPGCIAHRVVNTGNVPLTFLACWPSDAGYDYDTIDRQGFSVRILNNNGIPKVIAQD